MMQEMTVHLFQRRSVRILTQVIHPCGLLIIAALHFYLTTSMLDAPAAGVSDLLMYVIQSALLLYFFIYVFLDLLRYSSKCRISAEGVTLIRPLMRRKLLPWSEFQQVCICYRDGVRGMKPEIFCFVRHGEKKTLFGRWRTGNPFHQHRLIAPDYSKALHQVVAACCPTPIADLRTTPDYAQ